MKFFEDDCEILQMAFEDGVRQLLLDALDKPTTTVLMLFPRIYLIHTAKGDSGYRCLEAATLDEYFDAIERLPRLLGRFTEFRVERNENAPPATTH